MRIVVLVRRGLLLAGLVTRFATYRLFTYEVDGFWVWRPNGCHLLVFLHLWRTSLMTRCLPAGLAQAGSGWS